MDAVITYVNGADKHWQQQYNKFVKKPIEEARYRDWGTMPYLVKGIRKFMTYIDKIFIVVADEYQIPVGVDLNDVTIVYHKDIIPAKYLPCFNSCVIEMFIPLIVGLSEQFVYFNDDTFVVQPSVAEDFFIDNKPVLNPKINTYGMFDTFNCFTQQCINSTNVILNKFDIKKFPKMSYLVQEHRMRPFLKSSCMKVLQQCNKEISASLTRVRHEKNLNSYIFNNYDYLTGNYVVKDIPKRLIYTANPLINICNNIEHPNAKFLCINDNSALNYYAGNGKILEAFVKLLTNKTKIKDISKIINNAQQANNLNVALCCVAKNENLYIREWVEYYKKLGVSKIFIYDNNDIEGEHFEDVINNYITSGFVKLINKRGLVITTKNDKTGNTIQGISYSECYNDNCDKYDWIMFFDCDEYFELNGDKFKTLNEFLSAPDWNLFDGLRIQWKMYGDNEHIYYENKSLVERFKSNNNWHYDKHIKTILKCNSKYKGQLLFCAHGPFNKDLSIANLDGNVIKNPYLNTYELPENLSAYLCHFYSKSTEEFIKRKWKQTSAVTGINITRNYSVDFLKKQYFEYNKITAEKEKMFNDLIEIKEAKNADKPIISFTSYKERLQYCHIVVQSLIDGTVQPYKIVLTLYKDDVKYITPELQAQINKGVVELLVCDIDIRSHKKYFYTMQKYKEYPIITIDDDCMMQPDFLESMINTYKKYPDCVAGRRVHRKTYSNGLLNNYENWIMHDDKTLLPSFDIVCIGVGGVLYPPNILHISDDNLNDIYEFISVDDMYLHYLELKNNISIVWVQNNKNHPTIIEGSQKTALYLNDNKIIKGAQSPNNIAIKKLFNTI